MPQDTQYLGKIFIDPMLIGADANRVPRSSSIGLCMHPAHGSVIDGERTSAFDALAVQDGNDPYKVLRGLQAIVDAFPEREFTGCIYLSHEGQPDRAPSRFVVRGRKVVRDDAHLGWPAGPDDEDPDEGALLDILTGAGDGGTYVEKCTGDFDRGRMCPAEYSDLPDRLVAWKNAAVSVAIAAALGAVEDAEVLALVQARAASDSGRRTSLSRVLAVLGMTEADMEATD